MKDKPLDTDNDFNKIIWEDGERMLVSDFLIKGNGECFFVSACKSDKETQEQDDYYQTKVEMFEVVYQTMYHCKVQGLKVCSTFLYWGNMTDLSIKYQNYQQDRTVLTKEKEDRDMSPRT